eukprot:CCRYP_008960-RA/>CCRYP_008960-RA protein AED:0.57 eAED:0.42 QI:0/-1/0/1/-1/0/1/0/76
MFLNIPLVADWQAIATHHKHHINEKLCRANRKRHQYYYAPSKQVLKNVHKPAKLGIRPLKKIIFLVMTTFNRLYFI